LGLFLVVRGVPAMLPHGRVLDHRARIALALLGSERRGRESEQRHDRGSVRS
jgi:hypothetical protein